MECICQRSLYYQPLTLPPETHTHTHTHTHTAHDIMNLLMLWEFHDV